MSKEPITTKSKHSVFKHDAVKPLRKKLGLTLQEVADKVGTSKGHVWELENGEKVEPSLSMAVRLAKCLRVSVNALVRS